MIANLNGVGSKVVPVTVDCHTIGTDYGEFNNTLTCPANAPTKDYKTSWYRLDITGTDTLDLTVYINEKTDAGSTDIKYRMMTGSCGAMQEQSCVQDALTRNTYECMVPGNSYYIQVFTPVLSNNNTRVTGEIELNISSVKHVGACAPANNCIAVAEFFPKFDCSKDRNVSINNLSTFGSDIKYDWDFGYNNQKSNAVSPEFFYPALTTNKTYTINLIVTNLVCGKTATISKTIDIPARPAVNLGGDTIFCTNGSSLLLDATSHTGSTYYWNYGFTQPTVTANSSGNWIAEVTYNNCKARDTINVWINPIAKKPIVTQALCNTDQVSLNAARGQGEVYRWNTGGATASISATQPGYYWCDLFLNGCTIRDSFYVINPSVTQQNKIIQVCQKDMPYQADATISGASSYMWRDNNTNAKRSISTPGIWWVDVTISGCTIRDSLTLKVDSFKNVTTNARICFGQNYRLPSGKNVNISGTHRDTLRNVRGCDSLITRVNLTVESPTLVNLSASIYQGQNYTLPWGKIVNTAGIYRDTLKNANGCDSTITIFTLSVLAVQTQTTEASVCWGNSYSLPWGGNVKNAGSYSDTLKTISGSDSIIKIVNLSVAPKSIITSDTIVCQGISFSFRANNAVTYKWSPANNLSATGIRNPMFTANQTRLYKLEATYSINGTSISCTDSVRIQVVAKTITNRTASICSGQTYTLPGGKVVNTTGLNADTLRSITGCDSLITNVNLTVQNALTNTLSTFICQGQNYTLPSGRSVNATGLYRDTLRYVSGCDSVITNVTLTRYDITSNAISATICLGNSYTLPSGKIIAAAGTYRDTLRYSNGCDSIRYTATLSVTDALRNSSTAYICTGGSFRLPSGRLVSTAGLYRDTVRTATGCDSLISNMTLVVDGVTNQTLSPVICQGTSYKLLSGRTVSLAGNYRDTLRNIRGCDSIRFTVNLSVSAVRFGTASATLCAGQTYTRPSGKVATASGTYLDTLRSLVTGCDSIVNTTLTFRSPLSVSLSGPSSVCTGVSATLTATASGGNGGPYTFSWTGATGSGNTVTVSPSATTKYIVSVSDGCTVVPARDSVTITYVPPPQPGLNNATVTICRGSSVTLTATGGATYLWSPATGLSNTAIARPVASPVTDTRYRVRVTTATGCIGEDSILVKVTQPFTLTASLDTFVCAGGTVPLSAAGAVTYEWAGAGLSATAGASLTARPAATTTYTVTGYGTDNCFTQTKNIRITVIALPVVNAGRDTTIMVGSSFVLRPSYTGNNLQYNWTPATYLSCADCARPTTSPREPMEYSVEVRNAFGCTASDKLRIELRCNAESIFLPNTFTPNGDGANDIWYPRGGGIKTVRYLKVFNRWGQVIFERSNFSTDDRSAGWDGTYQGQPLPPDVFVYTLGTVCDNGQNLETKGNVMIVR
jgi:gliding motility-associated-like protein